MRANNFFADSENFCLHKVVDRFLSLFLKLITLLIQLLRLNLVLFVEHFLAEVIILAFSVTHIDRINFFFVFDLVDFCLHFDETALVLVKSSLLAA